MSILELWLLIVVMPSLNNAFGVLTSITFIIAILSTAGRVIAKVGSDNGESDAAAAHNVLKPISNYTIVVCLVASVGAISLPTEKQLQYIVGGYVVTNVEDIEKLPANLVKAANKFLDDFQNNEEK